MNKVATAFEPGRKALIAYVTAGYPSIEATLEVVPVLARNGCDMVEIGIPFSDPLADGATIQNASHHALQRGVTPATCIELAGALNGRVGVP
ncbi:MAG: tryptophan synthase subunit alpha, partial [Dehalococcoidia bacterium]|nr:tryptophan synthase subunit alpha [Dehalococcoidia bacterium]